MLSRTSRLVAFAFRAVQIGSMTLVVLCVALFVAAIVLTEVDFSFLRSDVRAVRRAGGRATVERFLSNEIVIVTFDGERVTDEDLICLEPLRYLRHLRIHGGITDAGLAHIRGLSRLRTVDLLEAKVTDAGMKYLAGLKQLRSLVLIGSPITDAGLVDLGRLSCLQTLDLSESKITDAGLSHLGRLGELQVLRLTGCQVTEAGVEKLRKALPRCEIAGP
jgi:hypothetical protein